MSSFELHVSGFSKTDLMETLRVRYRMSDVLFDRKHRIRFSLSVIASAVGDSLMANMMDEQETCPCLCSYPSPFRRESELVLCLAPAVRQLLGQDRCPACRQEDKVHPASLPRK